MKDVIREAIKGLLIPELNEIKHMRVTSPETSVV